MPSDQHIVAALDIGATMIRAMVAQAFDDDGVYCLGFAEAPAEGVRRGVIVNMDKLTRVISWVIEEAEERANVRIDTVLVGIAGDHIRSINSQGAIHVSRSDSEILQSDVRRAIDAARDVAIPADREIIHVIPQEYTVDDQEGVRNPIGMSGSRLEVATHIVTCASATAKNIFRALERCDLSLGGFALESYAASQVAVTEEEMELGVALIDLGGGGTEIAVFKNGCIRYSGFVPLGAQNVTNDIAIGLRATVDEAERLKLTYGAALASSVKASEMMEVEAVGGRPSREIGRSVLATIIEARVEEIFTLVARELRKVDVEDGLAAGVTLVGGGALLPGIADLAEQALNLPAKVAAISGVDNLPDGLDDPRYATVQGLIVHATENDFASQGGYRGVRGMLKKIEEWITGRL